MEERRERVLIIGASGYFGKKLVTASLDFGHPTFILYRPEVAADREKCQQLMEFKMRGARLIQASFDDHSSLLTAIKLVDVVISAIAGDSILEQLKLIEAIKESGNIKRFLPSEFGMDVDRMEHAIPPGNLILKDKRTIRLAVEKENIPHTYISASCLGGIFAAGLAQLGTFMPPRDRVVIYGNGDKRCPYVDEADVAELSLMAIGDPRTLNKTMYIHPRANFLSQVEIVKIWENFIGKELKKTFLSQEEWLAKLDSELPIYEKVAVAHMYQIYYLGDLDFKVEGPNNVNAGDLYSDYKYILMEEYLERFA